MNKINKIIIYILLILNFNLESNNQKNKYLKKTNEYLIKINKFLEKNGSKILKISFYTGVATLTASVFYAAYKIFINENKEFNKNFDKLYDYSDLYKINNDHEDNKICTNIEELILNDKLKNIFNINKNIASIIYKKENTTKIKNNNSNNINCDIKNKENYKIKLIDGKIIDIKEKDFNNFKNLIHDFKIYNFLYNYTDIKNNSYNLNKINNELASKENQENINLINQYAK